MGVIHKLKKEVADFIIQIKRENPSLSCRGISNIIFEKYQIKISKSSVNATIKKANLSSSVGRKSLKDTAKKFEIPQAKKLQLFESVSKVQKGEDIVSQNASVLNRLASPPVTELLSVENIEEMCQTSPMVEQSLIKSAENRDVNSWSAKTYGLGVIFSQCLEWDFSQRSFLIEFLSKNCDFSETQNTKLATYGLIYESILDKSILVDEDKKYFLGLNALCGVSFSEQSQESVAMLKNMTIDAKIYEKYVLEKEKVLLKAKYFNVFLEDGTKIMMDSHLAGVWIPNIREEHMMFANKTMLECSNRLINNFVPLIFSFVSGRNEGSKRFYEIIASCENFLGKRIKKVSLCDKNHQEIAQTSLIPIKKRFFILSVWPWQQEFKYWFLAEHKVNNIWENKQVKFSFGSKLRQFRDNQNKGYVGKVKAVSLWRDGKAFGVLLSNNVNCSSRDIIASYVQRWPLLDQASLLGAWKKSREKDTTFDKPKQGIMDIDNNIFADFGAHIKDLCMKDLLLLNSDKEVDKAIFKSICELEGVFRREKGFLEIKLIVPEDFSHKDLLQEAFNRVNERNIVDFTGDRVSLSQY